MTIELPSSHMAPKNTQHLDATFAPNYPSTTWLGVDLTLLGAFTPPGFDESPFDQLNYPRLAASVRAAQQGGFDFVTFGSQFQAGSDFRHEPKFGAVYTASRLAEVSQAGIFAGVEGQAEEINAAVDLLAAQEQGWGGITISVSTDSDFQAIEQAAVNARASGVRLCLIINNPSISDQRAEFIVSIADAVRLRVADPHAAREARFKIRAAGKRFGKDIRVFAEMGIVISASVEAAEERFYLIERMNGCEPFAGIASVLGTVYTVADAIESWVGLGAADGIILLPASLPTDLASALKGVIPLLQARAKLDQP